MRISVWAALLFVLGSGFTAILLTAKRSWFGASDLIPFSLWLAVSAFFVAIASLPSAKSLDKFPLFARIIIAIIFGALFGIISSTIPLLCLGPWAMAFSFPVPLAMIAGSIAAFLSLASTSLHPPKIKFIFDLGLMVILSFTFTILSEPIYHLLTNDVTVEMTFVEWQVDYPREIIEDPRDLLNESEEQSLLSLGLTGKLIALSRGIEGSGPQRHMIIILQSGMIKPVHLPIPRENQVVYIVRESLVRMVPAEAETYHRYLWLEMPPATGGPYGRYTLELADGSKSGGITFVWSTPAP